MKDFLTKQINDKKAKLNELRSKVEASESLEEVRNLTNQMEELRNSISEFESELRKMDVKEPEVRGGLDPKGAFDAAKKNVVERTSLDRSCTEYRQAFMTYTQTGKLDRDLIKRAGGDDGYTITPEIGMLIPETILNRLIEKAKGIYGTIFSRVTKTSIKGGVKIPIGDFLAKAHWITEDTVSNRQKIGDATEYIEFSYHTLEIRVANSMLSSIVSLDIFEEKIVENILHAYYKEMDTCIVAGDGSGKPLGVTADPRVTNVVTMTEEEFSDWKSWRTKLFAEIPLALRGGGEFMFPVSTVEKYLRTMHDDVNRPIYADAYTVGLNLPEDGVTGRFNGRPVLFVEPDLIADFETAASGDVVGIFWQPSEYMINTNMEFGMRRYFDEETNQWVNKALTVVDGKMVDTQKCWLIKKA